MKGLFTCLALMVGCYSAQAETLRLAVTTSFQNSGLADILVPEIATQTGIEVQLLAVGTGQAIRLGQAGDVDAILVHSRAAEEAFVADGFGTHRREIMYNDFVLIGPSHDPAETHTATDAATALSRIAASKSDFVSRGDDSGTHRKELSLWEMASMDPQTFEGWYKSVGAGMGATLNIASATDAYVMSDRASWLNFGNKGDLVIHFSGDPVLFNQYAFLPVNPKRHPHAKFALTQRLEDWLTSDSAKGLIDGFEIDGERLFTFNADK